MRTNVLLVEDEGAFVDALTIGLSKEGFAVDVARDGVVALDRFKEHTPDIVLLDVMLPKLSGIDVCREIRRTSQVPIIMVSARTAELDAVLGLELGADDYVAKPYRLRELVARMRAVMRRSEVKANNALAATVNASEAAVLELGDVSIDVERHKVVVRGVEVKLPLKEFELLELLMRNAGRVLTRSTLIDEIWGLNYYGDTKTLDVHIKRLRSKIEREPSKPEMIVTIRGLGYKCEL